MRELARDPELDLALQIVDQAVSDVFKPKQYNDEVRKKIEEAIQGKVEGQEITAEPAEEPKAQVIDLIPGINQIIIYLVAIIILLTRPRGLMGRKGVMEE